MKVFEHEIENYDLMIADMISTLKKNKKRTRADIDALLIALSTCIGLKAMCQTQKEFDSGTIDWPGVEARKNQIAREMTDEAAIKWNLKDMCI